MTDDMLYYIIDDIKLPFVHNLLIKKSKITHEFDPYYRKEIYIFTWNVIFCTTQKFGQSCLANSLISSLSALSKRSYQEEVDFKIKAKLRKFNNFELIINGTYKKIVTISVSQTLAKS